MLFRSVGIILMSFPTSDLLGRLESHVTLICGYRNYICCNVVIKYVHIVQSGSVKRKLRSQHIPLHVPNV